MRDEQQYTVKAELRQVQMTALLSRHTWRRQSRVMADPWQGEIRRSPAVSLLHYIIHTFTAHKVQHLQTILRQNLLRCDH